MPQSARGTPENCENEDAIRYVDEAAWRLILRSGVPRMA